MAIATAFFLSFLGFQVLRIRAMFLYFMELDVGSLTACLFVFRAELLGVWEGLFVERIRDF